MGGDRDHVEGLIFVACMFIGAGIGMLFDKVAVGGALGMGFGFLAMALIRAGKLKAKSVEVGVPKDFPSIVLMALGILVICAGVLLLVAPEIIYPYLAGLAVIVFGFPMLLLGLRSKGR